MNESRLTMKALLVSVNSPTFGQITSANTIGGSGLNRVIQVAGRFEF